MTNARIVDDLMRKCQRYKERIAELEADVDELSEMVSKFDALLELQPCGHPRACVRVGEEKAPGQFVHVCAWCESLEVARWQGTMDEQARQDRMADIVAQVNSTPFPWPKGHDL